MKKTSLNFEYCPECYTELHYYFDESLDLPEKYDMAKNE